MKHTPIFSTKVLDRVDSHNLNAIVATRLNRDKSNFKKPLVSIWVGLGIGIIVTSLSGCGYVQAEQNYTSTIASTQGDVCMAKNPIQEAQVASSLSQARLVQTNTNLQKFQSNYDRDKSLASQGKVTPKQLQTAKVAYDLAQLQRNSALKGLQHAQSQTAQVENC